MFCTTDAGWRFCTAPGWQQAWGKAGGKPPGACCEVGQAPSSLCTSSSTTYMCTRVWWGWRLGLASQSLSGRGRLIGADNKPETQYWHLQWPRCLCLWRAGLVFIPALPEDHLGNPKERKATCSPYCCTGKWRRLGSDPPLQEEESCLVPCMGVRAGPVLSLYLPNSPFFSP